MFTTRNGTPIENRQCSERLKKLCERHSLRYIRPHDLRHEFATLSLAAGVGIKTVSELMGHSSIAITADLYGHVLDESRRQASSLLNQLLTRQNVAGSRVLK